MSIFLFFLAYISSYYYYFGKNNNFAVSMMWLNIYGRYVKYWLVEYNLRFCPKQVDPVFCSGSFIDDYNLFNFVLDGKKTINY